MVHQIPRSDLQTGKRISLFQKAWEKSPRTLGLSVVRGGYRIQLRVLPQLFRSPPQWCTRMPQDSARVQILKEEVIALLQKTCNRRSQDMSPKKRLLQSSFFLVKKRSGGWRPVIDLSRLNKFVLCPHFKMETLDTVRMSLKKGDWVTSLDLKDAYFHIPIHRNLALISESSSWGKYISFGHSHLGSQ